MSRRKENYNESSGSAKSKVSKPFSTKKQQPEPDQNQRTLKSFFSTSSGKLIVVKPYIELEIEMNLCALGIKTKILHYVVLDVPKVTQEIFATSALANTITTAKRIATTTTAASSSSGTIEPSPSSSTAATPKANVNFNIDDDAAAKGLFFI